MNLLAETENKTEQEGWSIMVSDALPSGHSDIVTILE